MAPTVALTFDDGPNPDATPRVLELLASRQIRATFFVWGERAQRHPELLRLIVDSGHSLQPHCWEHVSHWTLDRDKVADDIDRTIALLGEVGAPAATLWRPPYGRTLRGVTATIAVQRGLALAGWTINPHDYAGHPAAEMLPGVRSQISPARQAVLLLHDGHREPGPLQRRPHAGNTVDLVRALLTEEGLSFAELRGGLEDSLEAGPPGAV